MVTLRVQKLLEDEGHAISAEPALSRYVVLGREVEHVHTPT